MITLHFLFSPALGNYCSLFCLYEFDYYSTLCKWSHTVFAFCDSLFSLNIKSSKFNHIIPYIRISFLLKPEQKFYSILNTYILYVYVYTHNILLTHSSISGHLGCFCVLPLGIMLLWAWVQKSWHTLLDHCAFFFLVSYMIRHETSSPSWLCPFLNHSLMIAWITFWFTLEPGCSWSGHVSLESFPTPTLLAL